jgi:hypothetical protein
LNNIAIISSEVKLNNYTENSELTLILKDNKSLQQLFKKYEKNNKLTDKDINLIKKIFEEFLITTKKTSIRKFDKVLERVGRLKEQYKNISFIYQINVIPDEQKQYAIKLDYSINNSKKENKEDGIYCLSSNRTDLDAKTLWNLYTTLTEVESAFRSLKSELGLRPIYHQKEIRIDAHIFINILAYHVLQTIRYQLKQVNINHSWQTIRKIMSTQMRVTTTQVNDKDETIFINKTTKPTVEQALIYHSLGIKFNNNLKILKNNDILKSM